MNRRGKWRAGDGTKGMGRNGRRVGGLSDGGEEGE